MFGWLNPLRGYSDAAMRAVLLSRTVASEVGGTQMTTDHLLLSLLDLDDAEIDQAIGRERVESLKRQVRDQAHTDRRVAASVDMPMSADLRRALQSARKVTKARARHVVEPVALLLGILQKPDRSSSQLLGKQGVTYDTVLDSLAGNTSR